MDQEYKDGVYFDMPAEVYHALPRLSAHGIMELNRSAQNYWTTSRMNADYKRKKKKHFDEGHAYEVRFLFGDEVFRKLYAPEFDKTVFPNLITTVADITAAIEASGRIPLPKAKKDELIRQLMEINPEAPVLDALEAKHATLYGAAEFVEADTYKEIRTSAADYEAGETAHFLQGGHAEVSILWTDAETGVPMKARLDYMKPVDTVDTKTFAEADKDIDFTIIQHICNYGYFLQLAVYDEARRNSVDLPQIGGEMKFETEASHHLIFIQKGESGLVRHKYFSKDLIVFDKGQTIMRSGIKKFAENFRKYGTKKWPDEKPTAELRDEDFPMYMLE